MKGTLTVLVFTAVLLANCKNGTDKGSTENEQTSNNKQIQLDMENKDYSTAFLIDESPSKAFNAIMDFREWWSEEIEGHTDVLGETFFYHYKDLHLSKMKLIERVPNERLVYLVVDNQFSFVKDKTEWIDTKLIFDISKEGERTKVQFTHQGLVPTYECYEVCEDAWTSYIQGSLQSLITTGEGRPNPKEGGLNEELVKKWGLPDK